MPTDVELGEGYTGDALLSAFPNQYRDSAKDAKEYSAHGGAPQAYYAATPGSISGRPTATDPDHGRELAIQNMPGVGQVAVPVENAMVTNAQPMSAFSDLGQQIPSDIEHMSIMSAQNMFIGMATIRRAGLDTADALSSAITSYDKYRKEVGRNVARIMLPLVPGAATPLGAIRMMKTANEAFRFIENQTDITEKFRDLHARCFDTWQHLKAMHQAFRYLKVKELMTAGILTESQVDGLAKFAQTLNVRRTTLWGVVIRIGVAYSKGEITWRGARSRDTYTEQAFERLSNALSKSGGVLKVKKDQLPTSAESSEKFWSLYNEYHKKIVTVLKKAHEDPDAQPDKVEAGPLQEAFNSVIEAGTKILAWGLDVVSIFGPLAYHFLKLDAIKVTLLKDELFATVALINASTKTVAEYAGQFSITFKRARVDQGKSEDEAKSEATKAAQVSAMKAGVVAFKAAKQMIQDRKDHYGRIKDRITGDWDKFMDELSKLLKQIALYGGIAAGVVILGPPLIGAIA